MRHTQAQQRMTLRQPASWWGARWREALPTGNGLIGAAVYGGVHRETVLLTHADLWWGQRTPELPDVSGNLPEVRRLLLANRPREADRILADALGDAGYRPSIGSPLPLGDLTIVMPGANAFKQYRRVLDMATGEVTVSWQDGETRYERRLFVSRTHDMVVCELRSDTPGALNAAITLGLHDKEDLQKSHGRRCERLPEHVEVHAQADVVCYAATNDDDTDFGAVARLIDTDGQVGATDSELTIAGATHVLIGVKLFVKGQRKAAIPALTCELRSQASSYDELLAPHVAAHAKLFGSVSLDLGADPAKHALANEELLLEAYDGDAPTALVEKMWAYGRYLLVSATRSGGQPCHLLGLWCGEYEGMWAFHMVNENLQMIYWHCLPGNLAELHLPVFDYFDEKMDDFRENARKLYGCRGIYIPAPTGPASGLLKNPSPHIIHWTGGAGWVAQHYFDYFQFTGDMEFLRTRALPFMREAALFYEDFFLTGDDGNYISCPSNSPENTPGNYWPGKGMGVHMETTVNATMDFAIAKELLTNLIASAEFAKTDTDEMPKWQEMLERIPAYQVNQDGAAREWMHPHYDDNYHHRHESHLYPVFPGQEITEESDAELFAAFETAVSKRLVIGLKEQSGWSLMHMANVWARLGKGDLALECLEILSRSCLFNNFYTSHNDWRDMGIGVDLPWGPSRSMRTWAGSPPCRRCSWSPNPA
ncbi:MAG: glycoside hydrolase family 95 protein [Lentisphaeria bacterium]|nr:glycoside hydrolase family 95 protein [Lentisphaeria bacterium]